MSVARHLPGKRRHPECSGRFKTLGEPRASARGPRNPGANAPGSPVLQQLLAVLLFTLALLGCSTFKPSDDKDISVQRKQRNDAAVRQFEQARDFAEFEAAQGRWRERDLRGCRERLESILARNPDHLDGRLLLAETHLAENRPHEAVRCLEPALRSHAEDARVQYTTGLVWDAAGETARALSYYERAAKLQPDNELYSVVYRRALSAANSPSRAGEVVPTSYLQSAPPEARPAPADLVLQPASVLAEFGSRQPDGASNADHSNASVSAGKIAAKPEDPQVPISAAVLALQSGQPQLAVELLEPAVKQFPNSAPLYRALGTAYYRRGDYPSSQRALQQALSLDKSSALSYFLMGCTLAKIGQETAAENHFRQAELLDSRYAERRVGAVGSPPAFAR